MKKYFTEEYLQMANKQIKKCSISSFTGKCKYNHNGLSLLIYQNNLQK